MSSPNIVEHPKLPKWSFNTMMDDTSPEILIAVEIARCLRIKPSTVYTWAAAGLIPCVRINGSVRFLRTDIERWIKDHSSVPADSRASTVQSILPSKTTSVSRQTIKQAGTRVLRRATSRSSSQQDTTHEPPPPTVFVREKANSNGDLSTPR
jgi:excisionase family DNA binding protein